MPDTQRAPMIESLSFGLMGLSVLVAATSFVSAHRSPLPDFSKMGCSFAILLLLGGFLLGLYPPVSQYGGCSDSCSTIMEGGEGTYESEVDYTKVYNNAYKTCIKGARDADRKSKKIADAEGDPSLYVPVDMKAARNRCKTISQGRCTSACYTNDIEG